MSASQETLKEVREAARKRAASSIYFYLPTVRDRASWGCQFAGEHWRYWRSVCVEADGEVLALDEISECYSRHHDLTGDERAVAQQLARYVREGTLCVVGGFVQAKKSLLHAP